MPQVVSCLHCEKQSVLPAEATADRSVRCPACGESFEVRAVEVLRVPTATLLPPVTDYAKQLSDFRLPPLESVEADSVGDEPPDGDIPADEDTAATIEAGPGLSEWLSRTGLAPEPPEKTDEQSGLRDEQPELAEEEPATEPLATGEVDQTIDVERDPALGNLLDQLRGVGNFASQEDHQEPEVDQGPESESEPAEDAPEPVAASATLAEREYSFDPAPSSLDVEVDEYEESRTYDYEEIRDELAAEERERRRSPRAVTLVGGLLVGVGLGYGLLVGIGGEDYDSLGMLAALGGDSAPDAAQEQALQPDETPSAETPPAEIAAPAIDAGGEVTATYESPSDEPAPFDPPDDPAPFNPPALDEHSAYEPAEEASLPGMEVPPAVSPATEAAPTDLGGPAEFGITDLERSLARAEEARAVLTNNSLDNSSSLEAVGQAYANLCEVANQLTYLAPDSSHPDMMIRRLTAQDYFKQVLRYSHAREDARLVAHRWLSWAERPHGGVFFSGKPDEVIKKGSVYESQFPLTGGEKIVVLTKSNFSSPRFLNAMEAGVVGALIESPATQIEGYTGDAPRAVWAAHTIPLGKAEFD